MVSFLPAELGQILIAKPVDVWSLEILVQLTLSTC